MAPREAKMGVGSWLRRSFTPRRRKTIAVPRNGLPPELAKAGLFRQVLFQVLIILAIAILWAVSRAYTGIKLAAGLASPTLFPASHEAALWSSAILWTTVPSVIVTIYAKLYGTMVEKLKSCQPMLELNPLQRSATPRETQRGVVADSEPSKHSTVKLTLLLDYHRYWPLSDSYHAVQNRHFLLAACMLINLALILSSGLAAAVLSVATVTTNSTTTLSLNRFFNEFSPDITQSLQSSFDTVLATLVNGASSSPWTTPEYSFNPFDAIDMPSGPGNLTGSTLAYYSTLDCVIVSGNSLQMSAGRSSGGIFTVNYTFTDRGCLVTELATVDTFDLFAQTWTATCDSSGGGADVRMVLLAGRYDANSDTGLANSTLLSCKPAFWNATATVTTAANVSRPGHVLEFSLSPPTSLRPYFWPVWLQDLSLYESLDPRGGYQMNRLGNIVYNFAFSQDATNPFNSTLLLSGFPAAFNAMVSSFVGTWAYTEGEQTEVRLQGTFSAFESRLFVVPGTAIAVLIIMSIALASTVWVWAYVSRHRSVLEREVKLMLGHAMLVQDSPDITRYIRAVERSAEKQGAVLVESDLVEYAEKDPTLNSWLCWMDKADKIRVTSPDAQSDLEDGK